MKGLIVALCCMVAGMHLALAQEDVLRPNGRGNTPPPRSTASEPKAEAVASAGEGLVFRGGIEGGVNYSMASRTFVGLYDNSPYSVFAAGTGLAFTYGVYAEVELSPTVALGIRMYVDNKEFGDTKSGLLQDCLITDQFGTPIQVTVTPMTGEYTQTADYFSFTPLLRFSLNDNLFAQIGPTIQLPTGNVVTNLTQTIDPDEECSFDFGLPTESKVRTGRSESTPDEVPALRLGLDAAIGYRIPVGSGLEFVPRLGYQFMFTDMDNASGGVDTSRENTEPPARNFTVTGTTLNSLQFSIGFWFRM
ncbi:MAG: PorT family protein [Candidatus Kapabacteria bacterium]|nr:PorT family protein [Candidatus Kapabacteria bacterium]